MSVKGKGKRKRKKMPVPAQQKGEDIFTSGPLRTPAKLKWSFTHRDILPLISSKVFCLEYVNYISLLI